MAGDLGVGLRRSGGTDKRVSTTTTRAAGVQTAATREAGAFAERENMYGDGEIDLVDLDLGRDDAPEIVDTWEFHDSGDVDPLVGSDPEADPPDYAPGWAARPSVSIWPNGAGFDVTVDLPFHPDSAVEASLAFRRERLRKIAATLTSEQHSALRARSVVEAYLRIEPLMSQDVSVIPIKAQKAGGQTSRDRLTVIDTQFGLVPLWFFTPKATRGAIADLMWVGHRIVSGEPVSEAPLRRAAVGRTLTTKPGELARHAKSLEAALHQTEVVARYRALWPAFALEDYLDDLGLKPERRSVPAAFLVLIGAIPAQLNPKG